MIKYKDFIPEVTQLGLLGHVKESDSFESLVKQANVWINSSAVEIINVETVLLPNVINRPKQIEPETGASTVGQPRVLFQCVRVWYREK